jgi:hypothetical protein
LWCNASQAVTLKNIDEVEILIKNLNIDSQNLICISQKIYPLFY